jgi:methyltransferase (TIGR00027 family)
VSDAPIRYVSDTAFFTALYRAHESARPDAVFRDPYAERLAGERGKQIVASNKFLEKNAWPYIARTYLIDRIIERHIAAGGDMVVNLAAGLDTRPYWMQLPPALRWVEIDLAAPLEYKESVLKDATPRCRLERIKTDLADGTARRAVFARLGNEAKNALVIAEGLLVYLTAEQNLELARDIAAVPSFRLYALDLASPGLLTMLQKRIGKDLEQAEAPLKFAPREGPDFFRQAGWEPVQVESMLHVAAKLKRLGFLFRLFAKFPDTKGRKPDSVWGGVVLYRKNG